MYKLYVNDEKNDVMNKGNKNFVLIKMSNNISLLKIWFLSENRSYF